MEDMLETTAYDLNEIILEVSRNSFNCQERFVDLTNWPIIDFFIAAYKNSCVAQCPVWLFLTQRLLGYCLLIWKICF